MYIWSAVLITPNGTNPFNGMRRRVGVDVPNRRNVPCLIRLASVQIPGVRVLDARRKALDSPLFLESFLVKDFEYYKSSCFGRKSASSDGRRRLVFAPALVAHAGLDRLPDGFDDFAIAPAAGFEIGMSRVLKSIDAHVQHPVTPGTNALGWRFAAPADVDAQDVEEEFGGVAPFVLLELPALAGGEDGHDSTPVLGLELFRAFDEDESYGSIGVDVLHETVDVQHAGTCARSGRWRVGGDE